MNRAVTLVLALAGGLAGGFASRFVALETVHAQSQPAAPKEIRAQTFVLVDAAGQPRGLIGFDPKGKPVIKLIGAAGQTIWSTDEVRLQLETR